MHQVGQGTFDAFKQVMRLDRMHLDRLDCTVVADLGAICISSGPFAGGTVAMPLTARLG